MAARFTSNLERKTDTHKFLRELFGLFLLFWALLLLLSILSFDANDPSLNHVVSAKNVVHNKVGLFGAYASGFLNDVFGVAALLWPLVFAALGAAYISAKYCFHWWRWCGFFLLTVCFLVLGSAWDITLGDLSGGGMVGSTLYKNSALYLSPVGSAILWFFVLLVGLQMAFNFSWIALAERGLAMLREKFAIPPKSAVAADSGEKPAGWPQKINPAPLISFGNNSLQKIKELYGEACKKLSEIKSALPRKEAKEDKIPESGFSEKPFITDDPNLKILYGPDKEPEVCSMPFDASQDNTDPAKRAETNGLVSSPVPEKPAAPQGSKENETRQLVDAQKLEKPAEKPASPEPMQPKPHAGPIELPSLELLFPAKKDQNMSTRGELESRGKKLMACLADFDVQGELVRITPGPVVTMFEIRPAAGVRVNKIANLSDDISRALSAVAVRIQAPIPGSDTVGIEIPNDHRQMVNFREIAESEDFAKGCGPLTMVLGKDIAGRPYMADLSRMPHLLVAGATGAGKSVCLNCILVSLLYRLKPENARLLLVDPKRIEMALYTDVPHLVHPVVTEMSDAKNALDWAVHEMDRRYQAIARLGVRDVSAYNQKMSSFKGHIPSIFADLEPLPYLVIVIDELADLMMTASREVESSIVRLAQLARAAGIHMILATQRPSVDVVTGLIKANFPCRISFRVTSKHDSRTILDQVGAEHLLGSGDMLFKPSGGRPIRLHGPFLADEECAAVVNHWKNQLEPDYKVDFTKWAGENSAQQGSGGVDATKDPIYEEARKFVISHGQASISLIQRQFSIGFNRAARIMSQFESEGMIGPPDGSKPRQVIR